MTHERTRRAPRRKVRYAVVGLGYIAQAAVLPAFAHAGRNSELAALVSGDSVKRRELAKRYRVPEACSYEHYDRCLRDGGIDAVYIALPNSLHCEYAVRAARAGVHVLCEKPMAVTEAECETMIAAAEAHRVKLMVAYRLHFERATLEAIEAVRAGRIGDPRVFTSTFTMRVERGNIRLSEDLGGGTLYDIGIYCINAARSLFRSEPVAVRALCAGARGDVEESCGASLLFPGGRLATFACSFGSEKVSTYRIVGTRGQISADPGYELAAALKLRSVIDGKARSRSFPKRDQFAPELVHFSDCVLGDRQPEPSGREGLADVRVIRALYRSAWSGRVQKLSRYARRRRPELTQEMRRAPVRMPDMVHARPPSGG